jgi:hypothetical protein
MVYFAMVDLIGSINSKEAYQHYLRITQWCISNLQQDQWEFDYSCILCINGVNIPAGLRFFKFTDAIQLIDTI